MFIIYVHNKRSTFMLVSFYEYTYTHTYAYICLKQIKICSFE